MKEITTKIYRYEELSDDVRAKLIDKYRCDVASLLNEEDAHDRRGTLEKFEKVFSIVVRVDNYGNYSYESTDTFFDFAHWREYDFWDDWSNIKGKYLARLIHTRIMPQIWKGKYYSTGGRCINGRYRYTKRHSRIIWEGEGNCPLTGMCFDNDILSPLWAYLRGEKDESYDFDDLVNDCLHKFFKCWERDEEYNASDEAVEESLMVNEFNDSWHFKDGTIYDGEVAA